MDFSKEGRHGTTILLTIAVVAFTIPKSLNIRTNEDIRHEQYLILFLGLCFLLMKHFGIHLLDEAKPQPHLYTRIHGTWYDMATFKHPGGPISLSLVQDRDGTALFKSHHLLSTLDIQKVLKKYEVPKETARELTTLDANDDGGHYVWTGFDNDVFVKDIKQLLHSYFGPMAKQNNCTLYQAAKATPKRWTLICVLALALIGCLPFYQNGHYWTLFIMPILAWLVVANYVHDALHFSLAKDWRTNAALPYLLPILSSPWMWYHQHIIGHHAYTNVGRKDPDLAHAPQLKREHESIKWRKLHENQGNFFRFVFLWSVGSLGMNLLNEFKTHIRLSYNNVVGFRKLSQRRMFFHIIGRTIYLYIMFLWPLLRFPLSKAAMFIVVPNMIFSCLFMSASQINHNLEDCSGSDTNFAKHQVITAQNFGTRSTFWFVFSGGLNYQIEHHLFPFVNHCHLPFLAPGVKELCRKHGVDYKEALDYRKAFACHLAHTKELSKPPSALDRAAAPILDK